MGKCIFCDYYTRNEHLFCKDCYDEIKERAYNLDFSNNQRLRDYYFDLRDDLYSYCGTNLNNQLSLMYALALNNFNDFDDDYLLNRVEQDILDIRNTYESNDNLYNKEENKTQESNNNYKKDNFNDIDFRNKWPRDYQCEDGHYVRSLSEMIIDNWLYNHKYEHAYEKSVYMATEPEAVVLSDFYLPQGNVYIEFWGLEENEKYAKRKERKIQLYNENNINRIDLNESHIKRLNDIMPRELGKYIKR